MISSRSIADERQLVLPFVLLMLCLVALLVSVFGLHRTSSIAQSRFVDMEVSWQVLMEDNVEGAELLATDRLMQGLRRPVPAVFLASQWSLGLAALSLLFLAWLAISARAVYRARQHSRMQNESNDQAALSTLLDQIAPLASGSLDVHATVREGTPGALADAINYAVSELRSLAGSQISTARTLTESLDKANDLTVSTDRLCASQSRQIHDGTSVLLNMSRSAGELSEHAAGAAQAAKKVLNAAAEGASAVNERNERTTRLHNNFHDPVQLMRGLSNDARGIDDHLACINAVAKRIELLVLNCTLRATTGKDTAYAASYQSEISQLSAQMGSFAEQITNSTQAIRQLSTSVVAENAQALTSVHTLKEIADVHLHTFTAIQQVFDDIQAHSTQLQLHTSGMSEQAVLHASGISTLSARMDSVNQTTQQTLVEVKGNADTLDSLKRLANELRQGLADYNLPDTGLVEPMVAVDIALSAPEKSNARRAADRAVFNE